MTSRTTLRTLAVAAMTALSGWWSAAGQPTNLADPRPSPATSIEVSANALVVEAGGRLATFEGTYENGRSGQWVEFDDGEPVAVTDSRRRKAKIRKTTVQTDGKVVFSTDSGEILLGNGKYEKQNPTQPRDPRPQPNPQAFEIQGGEIVTVWVASG